MEEGAFATFVPWTSSSCTAPLSISCSQIWKHLFVTPNNRHFSTDTIGNGSSGCTVDLCWLYLQFHIVWYWQSKNLWCTLPFFNLGCSIFCEEIFCWTCRCSFQKKILWAFQMCNFWVNQSRTCWDLFQ